MKDIKMLLMKVVYWLLVCYCINTNTKASNNNVKSNIIKRRLESSTLLKFKSVDDNCLVTPSMIKSNGNFHKVVNITLLLTSDRHGHMKTLSKLKHVYEFYKKIGPTFLVDAGDISIGAEFAYYYGASKILEGIIILHIFVIIIIL